MPTPDETQAVTTPAPAAGKHSDQPLSDAPAAPAGDTENSEPFSLEEARKLRREHQALRKRLAEYEAVEKAAQEAALSESQKAQKRVADLEAQLVAREASYRQQVIRYEVMLRAQALDIVDPEAAVKLMDDKALEYDEAGKPNNVDAVLKKLIAAKAYLVKQPTPNAPTGTPAGRQAPRSAPTPEAPRRVTPL